MKKLTFSFILVIGFCFSFSELSAQHSIGRATLAKIDGIVKTKDQVTAGIQQQLPILYHELNQFPIDEVTEKTMQTARSMADDAIAELSIAPDDLVKEGLIRFAHQIVDRTY